MQQIEALSSETILIKTDTATVEISYQDEILFLDDFGMFDEGTILRVEPEFDGEDYYLKVWSRNHTTRFLGEELLFNIVDGEFAEIRQN